MSWKSLTAEGAKQAQSTQRADAMSFMNSERSDEAIRNH